MSLARESANGINNTQVYIWKKIWPIGREEKINKQKLNYIIGNQQPERKKKKREPTEKQGTGPIETEIHKERINNHGAPHIHHGPLCVRLIIRRGRINLSRDARCCFFERRRKKRDTPDRGRVERTKRKMKKEVGKEKQIRFYFCTMCTNGRGGARESVCRLGPS